MASLKINPPSFFKILIVLFCALNFPNHASASDPSLSMTVNGCDATISVTTDPIQPGENSIGLFFRLERTDGSSYADSYFMKAVIYANTTVNGTSVAQHEFTMSQLPKGDYKLVCYHTRKNRPIKTAYGGGTINSSCNPTIGLPLVGSSNNFGNLMMHYSWDNFATDPYFFTNPQIPLLDNMVTLGPASPWIFVTLTVTDWNAIGNTPLKFYFNKEALAYHGAVNSDSSDPSQWDEFQPVNDSYAASNGMLLLTSKGSEPRNTQRHIHLIFKKNSEYINSLSMLEFNVNTEGSNGTTYAATAKPPVTGFPHDPNHLAVDKAAIRACYNGPLTYRVRFQNTGNGPTDRVTVKLKHWRRLDLNSLKIISPASKSTSFAHESLYNKGEVSFHKKSKKFTIEYHRYNDGLPGAQQPGIEEAETFDMIEFSLKKKKECLAAGTKIAPKAEIVFYAGDLQMEPIQTDREQTVVATHNPSKEVATSQKLTKKGGIGKMLQKLKPGGKSKKKGKSKFVYA